MMKTKCLISDDVLSLSLSSVLVLHVVRGFLFLGEPVAGDQA